MSEVAYSSGENSLVLYSARGTCDQKERIRLRMMTARKPVTAVTLFLQQTAAKSTGR